MPAATGRSAGRAGGRPDVDVLPDETAQKRKRRREGVRLPTGVRPEADRSSLDRDPEQDRGVALHQLAGGRHVVLHRPDAAVAQLSHSHRKRSDTPRVFQFLTGIDVVQGHGRHGQRVAEKRHQRRGVQHSDRPVDLQLLPGLRRRRLDPGTVRVGCPVVEVEQRGRCAMSAGRAKTVDSRAVSASYSAWLCGVKIRQPPWDTYGVPGVWKRPRSGGPAGSATSFAGFSEASCVPMLSFTWAWIMAASSEPATGALGMIVRKELHPEEGETELLLPVRIDDGLPVGR